MIDKAIPFLTLNFVTFNLASELTDTEHLSTLRVVVAILSGLLVLLWRRRVRAVRTASYEASTRRPREDYRNYSPRFG